MENVLKNNSKILKTPWGKELAHLIIGIVKQNDQ